VKKALFLNPLPQGPFSNDDPMLVGEPFYELLVGMGSETLFNLVSEGLQIDRGAIDVGRRRDRR
jgi:hypothetical protein